VFGHGLGAGHPQHGAVGHLAGQLEHARSQGGDEHGHVPRTRGRQPEIRREGLALEGHLLPADERHQDGQVFAHVPGGLVEAVAVHALDHHLVREADAEREPSVHGGVDRERLLGENRRVTRVGRHDTGAELDPGDLTADHRERGQRVQAEDVGHPGRGEAVVGPAGNPIPHFDQRVRSPGLVDEQSKSHRYRTSF
jgi:hypothetical protein